MTEGQGPDGADKEDDLAQDETLSQIHRAPIAFSRQTAPYSQNAFPLSELQLLPRTTSATFAIIKQ